MDVATGDWLASENLEVCFEVLLEPVALMRSIGMVTEKHEVVVDGWQVWSSNARRSQRCTDKNFDEQEQVVVPTNDYGAPKIPCLFVDELIDINGIPFEY